MSRRRAIVCAVLSSIVVGATAVGADADAGTLPGGHTVTTLVDGTTVDARLYDETVDVQRGNVANIATSREAWLSGKFDVRLDGNAKGAGIIGGYVVGCQVSLHGMSGGAGAGVRATATPSVSARTGGGISLGPGRARYLPIIATTSGIDLSYKRAQVYTYAFRGHRGGLVYSQQAFRINGCVGYASARARFHVVVRTASITGIVTVWGKPFSLG